ncbi:HAD family hydrolase [Aphanothece sacrum FPU3]|nr:HAD family hydrolase [Aphanothece sacrum FPU3]
MIYSFDVFDTCLVRTVARPTDLFYCLFRQSSKEISLEQVNELVRLRIEAETQARNNHYVKTGREDITIKDIYECFDSKNLPFNKGQLIQFEMDLEYQYLRPIQIIKSQITQLRNQEIKIIFISDMYLPQPFIKKCLIDYQIGQETDQVYVSANIGLTKATGNLFKYILKQENIQPHQLYHTGDNLYGDVLIPQKLGIKTTHFKNSQLNRYEQKSITQSLAPVEVRSQISGISRVVRLRSEDKVSLSSEMTSIAANIIAPLLISYVTWIIQDANQKGLKRLYFVSRDGQILHKIARKLGKTIPIPECRYLYGSRQAWFLPSISQVNQDKLEWLIREGQSTAPIDLLKKIQIEPKEIQSTLDKFNFTSERLTHQLTPQGIEQFWQVIEDSTVAQLILEKAQKARQLALKYFTQEGMTSDDLWAIVDLGWMLRCQKALKEILSHINDPNNVKGYYLGIRRNCLNSGEVGDYSGFILQDPLAYSYQPESEYIFRGIHLIDQIFTMADHSLVVGYQEKNTQMLPIFKEVAISAEKYNLVEANHNIILSYVEEIAKTDILNFHNDELKRSAISNTVDFFANPQIHDVRPIAKLYTSNDQNESNSRPVARKLKTQDLLYFAFRLILKAKPREYSQGFDWLEGSVALSNPLFKLIFRGFLQLRMVISDHKPIWIYWVWFQIKQKK